MVPLKDEFIYSVIKDLYKLDEKLQVDKENVYTLVLDLDETLIHNVEYG